MDMTIQDIAKALNDCANLKCGSCKYHDLGHSDVTAKMAACQAAIIDELGNECRRIVEEMEEKTS